MRPCRTPKPPVGPYTEDEIDGTLSSDKWARKLVRHHETEFERLALVEDVTAQELIIRWITTGLQQRGRPVTLLGKLTDETLVSDWLEGTVEAEHLNTLTVKGLEAPEGGGGPLMYKVDDGEGVFRMPVRGGWRHSVMRRV